MKANDGSICIVGAGGNIGSHCIDHCARLPNIRRVTLIDPDVYEERNLTSQNITPQDIGRLKVRVQARRLRRINPKLGVVARARRVEDVPIGQLRAAAMISAVDSRRVRQYLNQIAWKLGMILIDAGVQGDGLLARLQVVVPAENEPCLECSWDEQDYALLEQDYPCAGGISSAMPSRSVSCLGSLVASLQMIECHKLLSDRHDHVARGRQIVYDVQHHQFYSTRIVRAPDCRFDHDTWPAGAMARTSPDATLEQVLEVADSTSKGRVVFVQIEGRVFIRHLVCSQCGFHKEVFCLQGRLSCADRNCCRCGHKLSPVGFSMLKRLEPGRLPRSILRQPLRSLGLRPGDVYRVEFSSGTGNYCEIGCDHT